MCKCKLSHEFIHLGSVMMITLHQLMRLSGKLSLNLCLSVQSVKLLLMKATNTLLSHPHFFPTFSNLLLRIAQDFHLEIRHLPL